MTNVSIDPIKLGLNRGKAARWRPLAAILSETSFNNGSKVQFAIDQQDEKVVVDSAIICFFALFGLNLKKVYQNVSLGHQK